MRAIKRQSILYKERRATTTTGPPSLLDLIDLISTPPGTQIVGLDHSALQTSAWPARARKVAIESGWDRFGCLATPVRRPRLCLVPRRRVRRPHRPSARAGDRHVRGPAEPLHADHGHVLRRAGGGLQRWLPAHLQLRVRGDLAGVLDRLPLLARQEQRTVRAGGRPLRGGISRDGGSVARGATQRAVRGRHGRGRLFKKCMNSCISCQCIHFLVCSRLQHRYSSAALLDLTSIQRVARPAACAHAQIVGQRCFRAAGVQ